MKIQSVSLWIGNFENEIILENYTETIYPPCNKDCNNCIEEEGYCDDIPDPLFKQNFSVLYHDEDFQETKFHSEVKKSIEVLLQNHSYWHQIIPRFKELIENHQELEGNTVVLLYDYKYDGEKTYDEAEGYSIKYIGTVDYDARDYEPR